MKFATKSVRHYQPHLRHVTTLPWKLKIQVFCRYSAAVVANANKLHFIASNFVIHPQILIFSVSEIANFSPN